MLQSLNADFASAMAAKQEQLDATQHKLRLVTRELAEQRQELRDWQARSASSNNIYDKIRNLEQILHNEDDLLFRWPNAESTPLLKPHGESPPMKVPSSLDADTTRGNAIDIKPQLMDIDSKSNVAFEDLDLDGILPTDSSPESLKKLQRIKSWQTMMDAQLAERLNASKETKAANEFQYRRIVSICTGVAADEVDEVRIIIWSICFLSLTTPFRFWTAFWSRLKVMAVCPNLDASAYSCKRLSLLFSFGLLCLAVLFFRLHPLYPFITLQLPFICATHDSSIPTQCSDNSIQVRITGNFDSRTRIQCMLH